MKRLSILFVLFAFMTGFLSACGGGETSVPQLSLSIDPMSLPEATVTEPYNQTVVMTASGGTNSYFYDCIISDGVGTTAVVPYGGPTAESRSCLISGTPLETGTFTVYFRVTDTTTFSSASAGPLSVTVNPLSDPLDNWQVRYSLPNGSNFNAVAYGTGTFAAVGDNGVILISSNGREWATMNSGTTNSLRRVTYGNGIFVVVGDDGAILTSSDGITWVSRISGTNAHLTGATYGNGTFVALGYGTILTSPDGVMWKSIAQEAGTSLTYGKGIFIAVGIFGVIQSSPDGLDWKQVAEFSGGYSINDVVFGKGIFVAGGYFTPYPSIHFAHYPRIFTSPDGMSWTEQIPPTSGSLSGVTYGAGVFIAVGSTNTAYTDPIYASILSSPDGLTWTKRFIPASTSGNLALAGAAFGNGTFIAVGGNKILQSGSL